MSTKRMTINTFFLYKRDELQEDMKTFSFKSGIYRQRMDDIINGDILVRHKDLKGLAKACNCEIHDLTNEYWTIKDRGYERGEDGEWLR